MVEPTPLEKYESVSWDDDIPNIWKNTIHVPNHQPDLLKNVIYHDLRFPRFGFDSSQYLFGQLQGVQWNVQKMIHPIRRWEFST